MPRGTGAWRANLSVSETAALLGFHAQWFPVCIKNGPKPRGHTAPGRVVFEKRLIDEGGPRRLTIIKQSQRCATVIFFDSCSSMSLWNEEASQQVMNVCNMFPPPHDEGN